MPTARWPSRFRRARGGSRRARAGGRVSKAAQRTDWGGYSGYFEDLDGHVWEVAYNPGLRLLPDGRVQLPDE
jgi:hypothetical protein